MGSANTVRVTGSGCRAGWPGPPAGRPIHSPHPSGMGLSSQTCPKPGLQQVHSRRPGFLPGTDSLHVSVRTDHCPKEDSTTYWYQSIQYDVDRGLSPWYCRVAVMDRPNSLQKDSHRDYARCTAQMTDCGAEDCPPRPTSASLLCFCTWDLS